MLSLVVTPGLQQRSVPQAVLMWHSEHRAALQADRAPGSPSSRQVHVPLVDLQVPDTAHIGREGR